MKCVVLLFFSLVLTLMAASPGIRPRVDAASYPSSRNQADFSIGAWLIPPEQAKKMFKLDLNRAGYGVVEVGVFPGSGKDVDLYPSDFTLYVGEELAALAPYLPIPSRKYWRVAPSHHAHTAPPMSTPLLALPSAMCLIRILLLAEEPAER